MDIDLSFITRGFNAVLTKINDALTWFGDLGKSAMKALFDVLKDVLCLVIDLVSGAVTAAMTGVSALAPTSLLTTWQGYWSQVDPGLQNIATAVGIVPALSIIGAAIGIRLVLQLIPFVRLGS